MLKRGTGVAVAALAGTTFNTAMKFPFAMPGNANADTSTTVLVYDYRQEYLGD